MANKNNEIIDNKNQWSVYVVDDDEGVILSTKNALENLEYKGSKIKISSFKSGKETIEALKQDNSNGMEVSVILLDIVMEKKQDGKEAGFSVLEYLREDIGNNITQVIVRTGQAGKEINNQTKIVQEFEINDFIDKNESSYDRIRTSVITSIRMYQTLKNLTLSERDLGIINSALMEYLNFEKKEPILSDKDKIKAVIKIVFNHLNNNKYCGEKKLTPECLDKLVQLNIPNLQIVFRVLDNAIKTCKEQNVRADDIFYQSNENCLKWKKEEKWLEKLFKGLLREEFIDCNWDIFKNIHFGEIQSSPIKWMGTLDDILCLYYNLCFFQYINNQEEVWRNIHKVLANHYCDKSGVLLKSDSLKTCKSNNYIPTSNDSSKAYKNSISVIEKAWKTKSSKEEILDDIINSMEDTD